ncbi:hypothetical protein [Formosa haliotis]|uniref:hypothetical protein n=1 Tax=Formosa haliotis TaxID=1555194 RepID=UPI0008260749|nr:hypothetical protein [Formosa haliotis]
MNLIKKHLVVACVVLAGTSTLFAQDTARELKSLVDMRASSLDGEMRDHGYSLHDTNKSGYDSYQNWWNSSLNKCVTTRVSDGRVKSIVNTLPADCGKNSNSNSHHNNHNNSHNNSSYNRNAQYSDLNGWVSTSAYSELESRGFRQVKEHQDSGKTYRLWKNNRSKQCVKTTSINKRISSIVDSNNCDESSSSHNSYKDSEYKDLKGWPATSAYSELESRGFRQTKEHQDNGKTYRIWSKHSSHQCVKTLSENKRITEIYATDKCD